MANLVNKAKLWQFTGIPAFRKSWTDGKFIKLACSKAVVSEFSNNDNIIEVKANCWTLIKWGRTKAKISFTFLQNMDRDILFSLFWGTKTDIVAWTQTITDQKVIAPATWEEIELDYISSDGNWVTSITVKDNAWTALTEGSDYSVEVREGITYIKNIALTEGSDYLVSWQYESKKWEKLSFKNAFKVFDDYEVKVDAIIKEDDGTISRKTVKIDPATFSGAYTMEFNDLEDSGDLTWTTLEFELNKWGIIDYIDTKLD